MTLDCRACGACCRGFVVNVESSDTGVPEPMIKEDLLWGRMMRETGCGRGGDRSRNAGYGRCIALRGEVGVAARCSIYEMRPAVCRDFEVGSRLCLIARRRAGLPVEELLDLRHPPVNFKS